MVGKSLLDDEATMIESVSKWLRPSLTDSDIDRVYGPRQPIYDDNWTPTMERALQRESDVKTAMTELGQALVSASHNRLMQLWRACGRVWDASPLELITPRTGLQYAPNEKWSGGDQPSPVLWSQEFCRQLATLLAHPVWHCDVQGLVTVIQCAVILRTDDRQVWKLPERGNRCHLLMQLHRKQVSGADELSQAIRALAVPADSMASRPFQLLDRLRKIVKKKGQPIDSLPNIPFAVYGVTLGDIRNIAEAIDTTPGMIPVEPAYQIFIKGRGGHDFPNSYEQLHDLIKRSWMHERRGLAQWLQQQAETSEE